jgi:predicted nucleic acid-binding protein
MDTVFVDTDIIIDLLAAREPFYEYAAALFSLADKGKVKICVSPLSFSNVNYLLTRQYNANQARKKLLKFKTLVTVYEVNDKTIELALASDFKDFEDGIQYFTAIENGIQLLLTRNLKNYKSADIPVMTAEDFIKQLDK